MKLLILALGIAVASCAPPAVRDTISAPTRSAQPRTLEMVVNVEVKNLSPKAVGDTNPTRTTRIFNAGLTILDAQDNVRPYLAEALPQLGSETWQAFADGRMETTWKLRPGLTWHDGQPLVAEDFVFALQVYRSPELSAFFLNRPQDIIDQIVAVDPQTIRIHWRAPFLHTGDGIEPLPRGRLAEAFAALEQDPRGQRDAFTSLRFWTTEYVGAGPYSLTTWEPASHIEGAAFDGHVLGKPRIDRVVVRFINDENVVLANMMAGQGIHLSMAQAMRFEQGTILRERGGFNDVDKKGRVMFKATSTTTAIAQFRPEYQQMPALLDLRVRRAIAHAVDRDEINEALFRGQAPPAYTFVQPDASYWAEVDRAITKYPFDPRRTERLMQEAAFAKGRDGLFVGTGGERFQPAVWNSSGAQQEKLLAIVADTWQRAGIDAQQYVVPDGLARDQQTRATFPGILINPFGLGEPTSFNHMTTEQIGTQANRWTGQNRGGWVNPEADLLWERFNKTLDRGEQIQMFLQGMKVHSEHVPSIPLHFSLNVVSHVAALKGPQGDSQHWNIHEWELTFLSS